MNLIVIQARMGSKRLPGKMILPINGVPLIIYILKSISLSFNKNNIIVATSRLVENDIIEELCNRYQFQVYRGDEDNVYSRFSTIQKMFKAENIVRITGDNPLVSGTLIRKVIDFHIRGSFEFTSTRLINNKSIIRYTPKGLSVDIISKSAFQKVNEDELDEYQKEHVIPVFYNSNFKVGIYKDDFEENCINYSYSIDSDDDYQLIKKMIENG